MNNRYLMLMFLGFGGYLLWQKMQKEKQITSTNVANSAAVVNYQPQDENINDFEENQTDLWTDPIMEDGQAIKFYV